MNMTASDLELLRQYARQNSEEAFAALVSRHLNLVYSAAMRQVRAPQLAEEVVQSVFADLARNVRKLKPDTILTAWLYRITRRTAIDVVRRESRRQVRERLAQEMSDMNSTTSDWMQIEPLLDESGTTRQTNGPPCNSRTNNCAATPRSLPNCAAKWRDCEEARRRQAVIPSKPN